MSTQAVIGTKLGMSAVFDQATGARIPVTVVQVLPNVVTQVKTVDTDGYQAVQVTTGSQKASRLTKARAGQFAKAQVEPGLGLQEFPVEDASAYQMGQSLTLEMFQEGQLVDVTGTSKGKGFAGTVKRWNFRTQDATHGNSRSHRVPGSTGQNQTPGRVFKGKKMAGHMGNVRRTVQSLPIVKIDVEHQVLLIKGAVPGAPGGRVVVKAAVKARKTQAA